MVGFSYEKYIEHDRDISVKHITKVFEGLMEKLRPIPAFYCCYLLRSTIRHTSLYIGSTPHPARRTAQHNGQSKGGAVRTSKASLRPWQMVCIVAGFPSNIAALQFEWAWHNAHLTKHITAEERTSQPTVRTKTNSKTGKKRKRPGRPKKSLFDHLSNLHLLLKAPYFAGMPLHLRFFNEAVHASWLAWMERVGEPLHPAFQVVLDLPQIEDEVQSTQVSTRVKKAELIGKGGIEGIDPTYAQFQSAVLKLKDQIDIQHASCHVCKKSIEPTTDLFNVCLSQGCTCLTHLTCLSAVFTSDTDLIVPKSGRCPKCKSEQQWPDLMKVLTLRMRGEKELNKLLKKRRKGAAAVAAEILDEEEDEDEDDGSEDELVEGIINEDDAGSDTDDTASTYSTTSPSRKRLAPPPRSTAGQWIADMLGTVIEDTEDED